MSQVSRIGDPSACELAFNGTEFMYPMLETLHAVEIFIFLSILTKPNNLYCFSIHLLSPCQMSHQWALHG